MQSSASRLICADSEVPFFIKSRDVVPREWFFSCLLEKSLSLLSGYDATTLELLGSLIISTGGK